MNSAPGTPAPLPGSGGPASAGSGPASPLSLDPVLLEVLACPADHHAPLEPGEPGDPRAAALTCTECGRVFPIRDGIPVLLLDEATGGPTVGVLP
jgi:uncharacterized protein YbaR (Trm112 family)